MPPFLAYPRIPAPQIYPFKLFEDAGYATGTNSQMTAITPSATAHTKGSYTQLIAATTRQTRTLGINLFGNPGGTASKSWLIDIAVGAAASEVVILPNLIVGVTVQFGVTNHHIRLPFAIPPGRRIAARCQTNGTSGEACYVKLSLEDGIVSYQGVDSLNADTATTLGTAITPGNAAESAYVELSAATGRAYKGFFLIFDCRNTTGGTFTSAAFDLATGAAGSEVVFFQNFVVYNLNGQHLPSCTPFVPFNIPAGVRLAIRARGNATTTAMGVSAYGVY